MHLVSNQIPRLITTLLRKRGLLFLAPAALGIAINGNVTTVGARTIQQEGLTESGVQTLKIAKPPNVQPGDVLVAIVAASFAYGGIPIPAGWTLIQSADQGAQILRVDTYYHVVDGTEPLSWSWQLASTDRTSRATGSIVAYRGVNTTAPIGPASTQCCTPGTNTSVAAIKTTSANNLVLAIFAEAQSNNIYAAPARLKNVVNVTNSDASWGNHHMFGELPMPKAGSTQHQIATNGKDTGSDVAQLISLQPSADSLPVRVSVTTGSVVPRPKRSTRAAE